MALWIAVLLGVVQGVFMFLPVSSTAHLVLTQHWLIGQGHVLPSPASAEMLLFDLIVHVGTLVSIVVVFHNSLWQLMRGVWQDTLAWLHSPRAPSRALLFLRLGFLCAFSVAVTAVIGFSFRGLFQVVFGNPIMVAVSLSLTGVLLWWTDGLKHQRRGLKKLNLPVAAVIGLAQGLALIPGLSRSGMTITFGLFTGLKRRWAAEYSFFLAIPTILAASLVQSVDVMREGGLQALDATVIVVAFSVSAVVGVASLWLVLKLLYRARLKVFSWYLWALALAVVVGWVPLNLHGYA